MSAKVIAEAVRTTLGPRGMDKMLVDSLGDITITNDGAAILDEMDVEHSDAKMMVEVAKTTILYTLIGSFIVISILAKTEKLDKKAGVFFILLYLLSYTTTLV